MSLRRLLHIAGAVIGATGVAMFSAAIVGLMYQEWGDSLQIVLAAAIAIGIGGAMWKVFDRPGELTTREGFAAVGIAWLAMTFAGTLPFVLTGEISNFTDAFFETAAGFSTTGSSILPDPGALSHAILFWRSLTQWIGGMGIIVLSIAILPLLGVGGVQLARAESPGVNPDRLTPRFAETARRLWLIYIGFTGLEALFLWAGEMTLFEAVNHSFTTMSTGGFGTTSGSIGDFGAYTQWVVIVFMVIAGTSFALHYKGLRSPLEYVRHPGFRLYALVLGVAAVVIAVGTWGTAIADTIRDAIFVSVTLVTTTGFGTADFGQWSVFLQIMAVGLMFIGGMAGSTSGSVKIYRHSILYQASRNDLRRLIHPRGVFMPRWGKDPVSEAVVESVQSFFLLYMFAFMTGTALFGIIISASGSPFDIPSTVSAVASALGNIGPGLGAVGPASNFAAVPDLGKWLLALLMIVGRLEIFPIVLLFTRELWRR
ncbi:MAG: TrkH family potassium uptake protein [Acidimicrobiia bacterium]|nr:TrkH family potassium uptake protein [Acidimicrobiia bacterium]